MEYDKDATLRKQLERALDASTSRVDELCVENEKLRRLVQRLYGFSFDEYPDGTELNFADELRELGIEVDV